MKNFMILIREELALSAAMTEAEIQAEIQEFTQWVEDMSKTDNFISGDPLDPEGRYITSTEVHSDGPFIESKEVITGYILIKAKDVEEAVALAKKCPIFKKGGAVELRPIMKY